MSIRSKADIMDHHSTRKWHDELDIQTRNVLQAALVEPNTGEAYFITPMICFLQALTTNQAREPIDNVRINTRLIVLRQLVIYSIKLILEERLNILKDFQDRATAKIQSAAAITAEFARVRAVVHYVSKKLEPLAGGLMGSRSATLLRHKH